ncbi:MAG: hypothetical protein HKN81_04770 [Gammaproteobacteria bacterium]|nr:hypothetical protein [Gammaproteobacteria bacterium]
MNKNIVRAALISICLVCAGTSHAFVGGIMVGLGEMNEDVGRIQVSFTADATLETEEMTADTKVYYKPGKVRDEMAMSGQNMVTIRRFDLNKVWMIIGQGMYMEVDPEKGNDQAKEFKLVSREIVGRETVNGMETTKYKSVYESKDGKFGGFTWFTDDNIAVKGFMISETKGEKQRFKFEVQNIERGAQDDSMFEIPAGYQKMNMGGFAGMGGMMKQQQMQQQRQQQQQAQQGAAPYGSQPQQSGQQQEDGGFVEEVAEESTDEAKDAASDEIVKGIGSGVRKGFGKLFGR